jgi:hypothetical protein
MAKLFTAFRGTAALALALAGCAGTVVSSSGTTATDAAANDDAGESGASGAGAGDAGDAGDAGESGGAEAEAGGPTDCTVCEHSSFTCWKPGFESVDFQVESQTATGCAGHIVQFGGPTTAYSIDCVSSQVCGLGDCVPAILTDTSFSWGGATCAAN